VALSRALKPGGNVLEVMVVNSWRNRVIYDHSLPENQRLTMTNIKGIADGKKIWHLEPSGLLGPVRILERIDHHQHHEQKR
jgi:hypothetical protein